MRSGASRGRVGGIAALLLASLGASGALAQKSNPQQLIQAAEERDHETGGMLGPYPGSREATGTSWQPDSAPYGGLHLEGGGWTSVFQAMVHGVYTHQGGDLGDDDFYSTNMFMLTAQRPAPGGRFGLRATLSLEPATIGREGYPLLLQTGGTADGRTPLVDRQHPHDLFTELAATYSVDLADDASVFVYAGFPGDPAVGPPTFMRRFSAMENPEAPIGYHWIDSTHVSHGVVTAGITRGGFKLDGSVFNGHEPDEDHYDIETGPLRSWAIRGSWNPAKYLAPYSELASRDLALQASYAMLDSPEQTQPGRDVERITASIIYNTEVPVLGEGNWQTTFAWGRNTVHHGHTLDAFLLESALSLFERHTVFGRLERVEKDGTTALRGQRFTVGKISLGYVYDLFRVGNVVAGIGALGSVALLREEVLQRFYGNAPLSGTFFVRLKIG